MKALLVLLAASLAAFAETAATPSGAFHVKVTGHGRPMLLIPGLSSSGETWDSTVARYQDRYECHVVTLAGFAGVPPAARPDGVAFTDYMRDQLAAYIRAHKLDHPVVAGHSLGGFLALALASKYPELPGRLIIVDAYPFLAGVSAPGITAEAAAKMAKQMQSSMQSQTQDQYIHTVKSGVYTRTMVTKDADFERVTAWGVASDKATVGDAMASMMASDLRDDVSKIAVPTLVLGAWAGYAPYTDRARTEAQLRTQYAKLKAVDIRLNDTARHFIMYDEPAWFFAQLDSVLGAPAPAARATR